MNPHQKPQEDVVVTQEDREAAASGYYCWISTNPVIPEKMKAGFADDHSMVQAFARHRLLGHEAGRRDMREAAGKVAEGWLASDYSEDANVMAQNIRDDIRAAPTEPLGGEG